MAAPQALQESSQGKCKLILLSCYIQTLPVLPSPILEHMRAVIIAANAADG